MCLSAPEVELGCSKDWLWHFSKIFYFLYDKNSSYHEISWVRCWLLMFTTKSCITHLGSMQPRVNLRSASIGSGPGYRVVRFQFIFGRFRHCSSLTKILRLFAAYCEAVLQGMLHDKELLREHLGSTLKMKLLA